MIHVKDLFRLQGLQGLRLVAGQRGLENRVRAAVLFEYDAQRVALRDFYRGDLVLTTLAYAREQPSLVARSLRALISQGVAGLVVKTGYYTELPEEVLRAADETDTPLFLFDDSYIEDALLEVTELIRGKRHFSGYERDLDALMAGGLSGDVVREKLRRMDPGWNGRARVFAIAAGENMQAVSERIFRLCDEGEEDAVFMSWRGLLLALVHPRAEDDALPQMEDLLRRARVHPTSVTVGESGPCTSPELLGYALREAVYAARAARLRGVERLSADALGAYAFLLPLSEDGFVRIWAGRLAGRLETYDRENNACLVQTAKAYVRCGRQIAAAAAALYQHPNTVRYRLGKIRAVLGLREEDPFEMILEWIVRLSDIREAED